MGAFSAFNGLFPGFSQGYGEGLGVVHERWTQVFSIFQTLFPEPHFSS